MLYEEGLATTAVFLQYTVYCTVDVFLSRMVYISLPVANLSTIAHSKNQPKPVTKKMVAQRQMFGSGPHEAPHVGEVTENEPKRGDSDSFFALGFFRFDFGGAIVESVLPAVNHT